jgi:hypothetical protein
MRFSTRTSLVTIGVVWAALVIAPVAYAASPELQYLQSTIKPLLDSIQSSVSGLGTAISGLSTTVNQILGNTNATQAIVSAGPKLGVVAAKITTNPSSTAVYNLDVNAIPNVVGPMRRYTVTIDFLGTPSAPGVDSARLLVGAFDGVNTSYQLNVAAFDPHVQQTLIMGPYTGTDSFVSIIRGADGSGPIDVVINAYIESQP